MMVIDDFIRRRLPTLENIQALKEYVLSFFVCIKRSHVAVSKTINL